jgi:hypothetical protein
MRIHIETRAIGMVIGGGPCFLTAIALDVLDWPDAALLALATGIVALDIIVAVCAVANYVALARWRDGFEAMTDDYGGWFIVLAALAIAGFGCGVAYVGGRVDPMFPSGTNIWMWPLVIVGAGLSAAAIARLADMIPDRGR